KEKRIGFVIRTLDRANIQQPVLRSETRDLQLATLGNSRRGSPASSLQALDVLPSAVRTADAIIGYFSEGAETRRPVNAAGVLGRRWMAECPDRRGDRPHR